MRYMCHVLLVFLFALFFLPGGMAAADGQAPSGESGEPLTFSEVEASFELRCAGCHGVKGVGTDKGPPLVHKIYGPSHHGDLTFYLAVSRGVRAHHWKFGDMPKLEGLGDREVGGIILYVRYLQRQAGID